MKLREFPGRMMSWVVGLGSWLGLLALAPGLTSASATTTDFTLGQSALTIAAVPGYNQAPVRIPLAASATDFDFGALVASDTATWLSATIDASAGELVLTFQTSGLVSASTQAVVTVDNGAVARTLTVTARASTLNVAALTDDPVRSRMYGVHQNGLLAGAVVVFDPLTAAPIASITVGDRPADLDVSPDGSELAVICSGSAGAAISIVDLAKLAVKETIPLASFDNWGVSDTSARVAFGPAGTFYYSDGSWTPVLRVLRRSDRAVLQTASIGAVPAASGDYGFGDFALSPDRSALYGWAQYGWTAGMAGSFAAKFSVATDGRLAFVAKGTPGYPSGMLRDPLDTRVHVSSDGSRVFIKQYEFASSDISSAVRAFPGPVRAATPGGEVVTTDSALFESVSGKTLHNLSPGGSVQAVTSDYSRLVYFDAILRQVRTVNLLQAVGPAILGRELSPADGSIVLPPSALRWTPLPGAESYRVYLGTSASAVSSAGLSSSEFRGATAGSEFSLSVPLAPGVTYYWRVDSVLSGEVTPGDVRSFTVSTIATSVAMIDTATVRGHGRHVAEIGLTSGAVVKTWNASSTASWITFESASGTTPATLRVLLNASALTAGLHRSSVSLKTAEGTLSIPVSLQVDPLAVTRLVTRSGSVKAYALSEELPSSGQDGLRAYLLEIDTLRERIHRVVRVGKGATDLAVHPDDGRVYVTNWRSGQLLAVDLAAFSVVRAYAVSAFGGVGYSDSDFYRISAGGPGRLVYEPADQWVDVGIFDTTSGKTLGTTSQRQGGGAYAPPAKRHYYHGDSNISNAAIRKFDTTGDVFTQLKSVPASGVSYYGSRTVLVSDDGSRIFWNGGVYDAELSLLQSLSQEVNSISGDGRYAFTQDFIHDISAQRAIGPMPVVTTLSAYNSATGRLLTAKDGALAFHVLPGVAAPGLARDPAAGSTVLPRSTLSWTPLPGATGYRVYLGQSASAVASATPSSPEYLGQFATAEVTLPETLVAGRTYSWRIDILVDGELVTGAVQTFSVARLVPGIATLEASTVRGHSSLAREIPVASATAGAAWTATSAQSWIRLLNTTGTAPTPLRLELDASALAAGEYSGSITLSGDGASVSIPVSLLVDPLAITRFETRPGSFKVYALSEKPAASSAETTRAYLLEIDTLRQRITRTERVGTGATDLAVHVDDGAVYVTNWRIGRLLSVDLDTFRLAETFITPPFAGVGYSDADVYRISAGGPGRLVVEAQDQWIDVGIFDTTTGNILATTFERQGDGAYAPDKRFYYHGDSNSSGAELHKLDTTGDRFTSLKSARAVGFSYYGSRTVLVSDDGQRVFWNGAVFDADLSVLWTLSKEINAVSGDGRYAFTHDTIYDTVAQRSIGAMPVATSVSAYNSLTARLLTFAGDALAFHSVAGVKAPGAGRDPANGSTVLPRSTLSWSALPGALGYRVYLGESAAAIASATTGSPEYLGQFTSAELALAEALAAGRTFYWRVDILVDGEVVPGEVQSFTVANLIAGVAKLDLATVQGHSDLASEFPVISATSGAAWTATTATPWIRVVSAAGSTPASVQIECDASALAAGLHQGSITLAGSGASISIPVTLQVDPLALTVMRSEPDTDRVFAISEHFSGSANTGTRAYLLEIDSALGRIARVVRAGSGVTDLALHADDERVYVTNWTLGRLLAFDRDTLALADTYNDFQPSSAYQNDVYRVSAGGPGRLVIEEEDQWIDVSLFNTTTGTIIAKSFQREGGGAFHPDGRYYFHGDNNISDASLHRLDTTGDTWRELSELRVSNYSYYGSRTVVMSEDGSRVFWNGGAFTTSPFALSWNISDEIVTATADGLVAFSRTKAYDVATRTHILNLPASQPIAAYNSASDSYVTQSGGAIVCRALGYILPLNLPLISGVQPRHNTASITWADRNLSSGTEIQWRSVGAANWTAAASAPAGATTSTVTGLTPSTAYQIRVRILGPFNDSEWSEPVAFSTTEAPPVLPLQSSYLFETGQTLSLDLPADKGWAYEVTGLPDGVTFDPATGRIGGSVAYPGRFTITIKATNGGGSTTVSVELQIGAIGSADLKARYTGLLTGDQGLFGVWELARDGDAFTGKIRLNGASTGFRGRFGPATGGFKSDEIFTRLLGMPVSIYVVRDVLVDRIEITVSIDYYYTASTIENTGHTVPWGAKRSYPLAGSYNILLAPITSDDSSDAGPEGRGYLRMNVKADGSFSATGASAVGQSLTVSGRVQINHLLPYFQTDSVGAQWGAIKLAAPEQAGPDLEGILGWGRYSHERSTLYSSGFSVGVRAVGSRWVSSARHDAHSTNGNAFELRLGGGGLDRLISDTAATQSVTLENGAFRLPKPGDAANPRKFTLSASSSTGLVSGSATFSDSHPATKKKISRKVTFKGLIVPNVDGEGLLFGGGYFLLPDSDGQRRSGWMSFTREDVTYVPEVDESYYDEIEENPADTTTSVGNMNTGGGTGSSSTGSSGSISVVGSSGSVSISVVTIDSVSISVAPARVSR